MTTKYKQFILSIIFSVCSTVGWSQTQTQPNYTLQSSESGAPKTYIARDFVSLKSGFSYKAEQGQSFNAKIDAGLLFPSKDGTYMYSDGSFSSDVSKVINSKTENGILVGSIPGNFAVTPSGAASYTIPIEVPVGINGIQPELSISYNSQSAFGMLGIGWNISGLSVITRGNKSIYFDNSTENIKIDNTDALYIDGQRLIYISGGDGNLTTGAIYATEEENYSRIVYNGSSFIFTSLDGMILEYGNTDDAKLKNVNDASDTRVLMWKLNKVTDSNGNSMIYTYTQNGQYISKINYTFNQTSNSGQEIEFVYQSNDFNPKVNYIKTFKTINDKLLQKINIKSNGNCTKSYTFSYSSDNKLQTVGASVPDGSKIADTKISWGDDNGDITAVNIGGSGKDGAIFNGDFNGDGFTDYLIGGNIDGRIYGEFPNSYLALSVDSKFNLYLNSSTGKNLAYDSNITISNSNMAIADIDDDHKDELIIYNVSTKKLSIYKYTNGGFALMNNSSITIDGVSSGSALLATNINNDQYKDIVFVMSDGYIILYGDASGINSTNIKKVKFDTSTKFHIGDFDADGKIDVLGLSNDGTDKSLGDQEFSYYRSDTFGKVISNKNNIITGDFNNDGLTDILFQNGSAENYSWKIAYNTGSYNTAPRVIDVPFHNLNPIISLDNGYKIKRTSVKNAIPIDYNGDGLMDFVLTEETYYELYEDVCESGDFFGWCLGPLVKEFKSITIPQSTTYFYKNVNGEKFELEKQIDSTKPAPSSTSLADINNDGISDLVFTDYDNSNFNFMAYSKPNDNLKNIVSSIGNSSNLGQNYEIIYKNFSDFEPYSTSETTSSIRPLREPLLVVDGYNDSHDAYGCAYEKPKFHTQGKGFLGFTTTTEWCAELGRKKTTKKYEINSDYNFIYQASQATSTNDDKPISSISQINSALSAGGKRYIPITKSQTCTDNLTSIVEGVTTNYDDYPNSITQTSTKGNLTNKNLTTFDYRTDEAGGKSLIPYLPKSVVTTSTQNDETYKRTTNYNYNNKGNVTIETKDPDDKGQVITEFKDFDQWGHPLTMTVKAKDADKIEQTRTVKVSYLNGRFMDSKTNILGEKSVYGWDENNGRLATSTDAYGRTTSYTYNAWGQLTDTHYPNSIHKIKLFQWGKPSGYVGFTNTFYTYSQISGQAPVISYFKPNGEIIQTDTYGLNANERSVSYSKTYDIDKDICYQKTISEPFFSTDVQQSYNVCNYDNYERPVSAQTPMGSTVITYDVLTTKSNSSAEGISETKLNTARQVDYNIVNGKKVAYTYYPSGKMHTSTPDGGKQITMQYDLQGRRTKLIDPDLGTIRSVYNGFGELVMEKQKIHLDKDSITTTYNYNSNGVLQSINRNSEITNYTYDKQNRVETIGIAGQHKQTFTYDPYDRVTNIKEVIGTREFNTSRKYDVLGRVEKETFPSGYYTVNTYDSYSNLIEVKDGMGHSIWKPIAENARGQLTVEQKGGRTVNYGFDSRGLPSGISSYGVVNMECNFNSKGNLEYRKDLITNQKEQFKYDGLNRLTNWDIYQNGSATASKTNVIGYNSAGNIESKTDLGNYALSYDGKRVDGSDIGPYALATIAPNLNTTGLPANFPSTDLTASYTDFKKLATLDEGTKHYELSYGVDDQRRMSTYYANGKLQGIPSLTKYYVGNYEEENTSNGNVRKIHYLSGAIYVDNSIYNDSLYYVYSDNQGSVIALTDASENVVRRYAYDPWGVRRNPTDWKLKDDCVRLIIDRGYATGHEHLDAFGIINMNGRVYDPLTAQFLSPDPNVTEPDNWLSYNRYAYCRWNPLNRIDPSGYTDINGGSLGTVTTTAPWINNEFQYQNLLWQLSGDGFGSGGFSTAGFKSGLGALYNPIQLSPLQVTAKNLSKNSATKSLPFLAKNHVVEKNPGLVGVDWMIVSLFIAPEAVSAEGSEAVVAEEVAAKTVSGSYRLTFESGKSYVGKGLESRMMQSINRIESTYGDKLIEGGAEFFPASSTREAFINEYNMMKEIGMPSQWDPNTLLYNKIWSPGKTILGE